MRITAARAQAAAEVLDLDLEGLTEQQITSAYRTESKKCHPDGGNYDATRWAAICQAKDSLQEWLAALAKVATPVSGMAKGGCRACGGAGYVQKRNGFGTGPRMRCVMCDGSGSPVKPDREN